MTKILDGFLFRAYAVLFGIVVGTVSTLAAHAIPEQEWGSTQHVLTSCIPIAIRPLSFSSTYNANGLVWNGRGYESSDGAQLLGAARGFDSFAAAQAYLLSTLVENRRVVKQDHVYDEYGRVVGERIIAENDESAIVAWREGTAVW